MTQTPVPSFIETLLRAFGRGVFRSFQSQAAAPPAAAVAPKRRRARLAPGRAPVAGRAARAPAPPAPEPKPAYVAPTPAAILARQKAGHEIVRYRQGRGEFEARIVGFNREEKLVTLERLSDGKRIQRPASKVYGH